MSLKTMALLIAAFLLIAGVFRFLEYQKQKRAQSSSYIEQSINSVKRVEAIGKERAETILQQERELESWE